MNIAWMQIQANLSANLQWCIMLQHIWCADTSSTLFMSQYDISSDLMKVIERNTAKHYVLFDFHMRDVCDCGWSSIQKCNLLRDSVSLLSRWDCLQLIFIIIESFRCEFVYALAIFMARIERKKMSQQATTTSSNTNVFFPCNLFIHVLCFSSAS